MPSPVGELTHRQANTQPAAIKVIKMILDVRTRIDINLSFDKRLNLEAKMPDFDYRLGAAYHQLFVACVTARKVTHG